MSTFSKMFNKLVKLAIALGLGCALALSGNAFALSVGEVAPAFVLDGEKGKVDLQGYRGKVVYVDFWASWCGPCAQSFPWMNEMQAKYGAKGFQVIGINVDAKNADAKKFLATTPASFVIGYDPKGVTPKAYGIKGMPSSYLIDRNGKVVFAHSGFTNADRSVLEAKIKTLVSQ